MQVSPPHLSADPARDADPVSRLVDALVRATADIAWFTDAAGSAGHCIGHAAFTGSPHQPAELDAWLALIHPDDRDTAAAFRRRETVADDLAPVVYRLQHGSGGYRWVEERIFPVRTAAGAIDRWVGIIADIDARVNLEKGLRDSEERLRLAASFGALGIWDVDLLSGARQWSADLKQIMGLAPDAVESEQLLMSLVHPDDHATVREANQASFQGVGSIMFRITRPRDGEERWIESTGRAIVDAAGKAIRRVGTWRDITAQKRSEALLERAASQDALTGLSNRQAFNAALNRLTHLSRSVVTRFAVVLIDLDEFKMVNDTLGHEVGDEVLGRSAERLKGICGSEDVVARLGGDEFAVLLRQPGSAEELSRWAARAVTALSHSIWVQGTEIPMSASLGAAIYPDQERTAADLLKSADLALYASKRAGRARALLFEPPMRAVIQNRAAALQRARDALIRGDIVPFYQPKVAPGSTREFGGFEALLRWQDNGTIKPPAALAEALVDPELSVQIGERMIELVAADIRRWSEARLDFGSIAVNVGGSEFTHSDIADRWLSTIRRASIAPDLLQVEVTETVFLGERAGEVGRALARLSQAGIKTALDDFGTGYASLTHLRSYPVDVLKIDKTFVDDIERDAGSRAIVQGLVALAHQLGIKVVAEGVETRDQQLLLAKMSCDFIQGYLIAKPMAASRVPHFVNAWISGRPEIRTTAAVGSGKRRFGSLG